MKHSAKPMERFYQDLLSADWGRRLQAYSSIERDLKLRGCYALNDDRWEDMKLLAGQIISIHFKKNPPRDLADFEEKLPKLYARLLGPLRMDRSPGRSDSMQLLMDIYDDDDDHARRDIHRFFKKRGPDGLEEAQTVLGNLFRCYEAMMQQAESRLESGTIGK